MPLWGFSNSLTLTICYIASHWGDLPHCAFISIGIRRLLRNSISVPHLPGFLTLSSAKGDDTAQVSAFAVSDYTLQIRICCGWENRQRCNVSVIFWLCLQSAALGIARTSSALLSFARLLTRRLQEELTDYTHRSADDISHSRSQRLHLRSSRAGEFD